MATMSVPGQLDRLAQPHAEITGRKRAAVISLPIVERPVTQGYVPQRA